MPVVTDDGEHRLGSWSVRVVQPLHGVGDRAERDPLLVEELLEHGGRRFGSDHVGAVEERSRRAGQPDSIGSLHDVDRIDSAAAVDDDALHLRRAAVRHQDMDQWIDHPPHSPLLTGCREADHGCRVSRAYGSENLLSIARPLRAAKHARQHGDELAVGRRVGRCCDLGHPSSTSVLRRDDAEMGAEEGIHRATFHDAAHGDLPSCSHVRRGKPPAHRIATLSNSFLGRVSVPGAGSRPMTWLGANVRAGGP